MLLCRKLALFDEWNSLAVYVSMDNTVVIEDISESLAGLPSRWLGRRFFFTIQNMWGEEEGERKTKRERERKRKSKYTCSFWPAPLARQGSTGLWLIIACAPFFLFPFSFLKGEEMRGSLVCLSEVPDSFPAGHPRCR